MQSKICFFTKNIKAFMRLLSMSLCLLVYVSFDFGVLEAKNLSRLRGDVADRFQDAPQAPFFSTLNINGSLSITNSNSVAITVEALSDITVEGVIKIFIPEGGSFTINGTAYTRSPIPRLTIFQTNQLGVRIDRDYRELDFIPGAYVNEHIFLRVQGSVAICNNSATSTAQGVFGFYNRGKIEASGVITINDNKGISTGDNFASAVINRGLIATSGDLIMSGNEATARSGAYGVKNSGSIVSSGGISIKHNRATSTEGEVAVVMSARGSRMESLGETEISDNRGSAVSKNASCVYNYGLIKARVVSIRNNSIKTTPGSQSVTVYNKELGKIEASDAIAIIGNRAIVEIAGSDSNPTAAKSSQVDSERVGTSRAGVFGVANYGDITTFGIVTISDNQGIVISGIGSAIGVDNSGEIQAKAISVENNSATSNAGDAFGVLNTARIYARTGAIAINSNNGRVMNASGDNLTFGFKNAGEIFAAGVEELSIKNNRAQDGLSFISGAFNLGRITASGAIVISDNTGSGPGKRVGGFANVNEVIATGAGRVVMKNNSARGSDGVVFGVYNQSFIMAHGALAIDGSSATSIEAGDAFGVLNQGSMLSLGAISIENNVGTGNGNNVAGIANKTSGTINASGAIIISHNKAICFDHSAIGVLNRGKIASSDDITMNDNRASSDKSRAFAVYNYFEIIASGAITMSNNAATIKNQRSAYGVCHTDNSIIKTGSGFVLSLATQLEPRLSSKIDLRLVAVTNSEGVALPFNKFTIAIDENLFGSSGPDYSAMQESYSDLVVLHNDNQS